MTFQVSTSTSEQRSVTTTSSSPTTPTTLKSTPSNIGSAQQKLIIKMESTEKVKSRWTRSFYTGLNQRNDDEKFICDICQRELTSPSNLMLHRNTHVIERPFKCEPCQVSFKTQGHLQKHIRSSAHESRVVMTQEFGVPTPDNPRPYGCTDCDIAFRKHGHLAKHLRSKSHITKIEANGMPAVDLSAHTQAFKSRAPDATDSEEHGRADE